MLSTQSGLLWQSINPTKSNFIPMDLSALLRQRSARGMDLVERQGRQCCSRMGKPAEGVFLMRLGQQVAGLKQRSKNCKSPCYPKPGGQKVLALCPPHHPCSILRKGEIHLRDCHIYHWCNLLFGAFYSVTSSMGRGSRPSTQEAARSMLPTCLFILTSLHLFGPDALTHFTRVLCLANNKEALCFPLPFSPVGTLPLKTSWEEGVCLGHSRIWVSLCPLTLTPPNCTQNLNYSQQRDIRQNSSGQNEGTVKNHNVYIRIGYLLYSSGSCRFLI